MIIFSRVICRFPSKLLVVIVGDSGVGKTSILTRFVLDVFQEDTSSTIGVDFFSKSVQRGNKIIKTQLWDTGNSNFEIISDSGTREVQSHGGSVDIPKSCELQILPGKHRRNHRI